MIEEKVIALIVDRLGITKEEATRTSTFDELGADSLDKVELIMELEKAFGINIPDEEMEKISTIQDAVNYIESKIGKALL